MLQGRLKFVPKKIRFLKLIFKLFKSNGSNGLYFLTACRLSKILPIFPIPPANYSRTIALQCHGLSKHLTGSALAFFFLACTAHYAQFTCCTILCMHIFSWRKRRDRQFIT